MVRIKTDQDAFVERLKIALWVAAGLLFAALTAAAVYKVWPILFPEIAATAPLNPDCDLRAGPCTVEFSQGGKVTFGIVPETIPVVKPLTLNVALEGLEAERVEVDFAGVDMEMGFNRPQLNATGAGRYSGPGMLPVCVRSVMEWEARVLIYTKSGIMAAPFRFSTISP